MSAEQRSLRNVFSRLALDRCGEHRHDADWLAGAFAREGARCLLMRADGKALAGADGASLTLLDVRTRETFGDARGATFLGCDDTQVPYFALVADTDQAERAERDLGAFVDLRRAGQRMAAFDAGLFAYARGLTHWQSRTRWCGACGSALSLEWGGHRARCPNTDCGIEHYPRTDPAIIVIVTWRDACLLGRQPSWPEGRWSTLAGFVEPGETLEDAVRREVYEEAGVRVVDCDYHSSQPWPFPSSLMLGFTARADDPTIRVGDELADARWFEVDAFVAGVRDGSIGLPPPLSVSYRLIEDWLLRAGGLELDTIAVANHAAWR